jgi:calcineurin-like phosphoesterase family protein
MQHRRLMAIAAALLVTTCSGPHTAPSELPTQPSSTQPSGSTPTVASAPAVLVGAGDIADCNSTGSELTARLLDAIGGTVFTAGDNAYPNGTAEDYRRCYGPTWGRHLARTRPSPGNHEYMAAGASGYFGYFGGNAGPAGAGYYSYSLGAWHVVSLNSEVDMRSGSAQQTWLRADLAANPTRCTVAYFHKPLFTSGPHGPSPQVRDLWRVLYEFNADVIVTGHDHLYERFAPQDPEGRPDFSRGIRQFVVGTGGAERYERGSSAPNSEIVGRDWGVLALTLEGETYRWEFVPVAGATFHDAGGGVCH